MRRNDSSFKDNLLRPKMCADVVSRHASGVEKLRASRPPAAWPWPIRSRSRRARLMSAELWELLTQQIRSNQIRSWNAEDDHLQGAGQSFLSNRPPRTCPSLLAFRAGTVLLDDLN